MNTYKTSEIARIIGIHPNTVRLYEKIGFITVPERLSNGYRIYSDLHIAQIKLVRTALKAEIMQNGLRKKAVEIIRLCADLKLDEAINSAVEYSAMIDNEALRAREAIYAVEKILRSKPSDNTALLTRKQAAAQLGVTADALRNWELNGLFGIKREKNGYRIYNGDDMELLKIIRTLRCANYSLSAILRLMNKLSDGKNVSVAEILNTPSPDDEIISSCDKLIVSLKQTKSDAESILSQLKDIQKLV